MKPGRALVVRFAKLPEAVRNRFVACLAAPLDAAGAPIVADSIGRWRARLGVVFLSALGLAMATILFDGRTMLNGGMATVYLLLWMPALLVIGYAAFIVAKRNPFPALPFKPGRYLFPLDFVDARGPRLMVRSLDSCSIQWTHHHINGGYVNSSVVLRFEDGAVEQFFFSDRALADWTLGKMQYAEATIRQAAENRDAARLALIDPFFEVRAAGSWEQFA